MVALGQQIAGLLRTGDVVCLSGQLGVGKSVFARAVIREIGGNSELEVPSPSFTLVQDYEFDHARVLHMDAYRLSSSAELWELGLPESLESQITLIEWPDRLGELTPSRRLDIEIEDLGGDDRDIKIIFHGDWAWKL